AYGLRLTAYGLRLTAYGLRLTAYGLHSVLQLDQQWFDTLCAHQILGSGQFLAITVRANLNAVPGSTSSGLDITDLGQQAEVLEATGQLVGIGDVAERGRLEHVAPIGTGRGAAGCWLGGSLLSAFLL